MISKMKMLAALGLVLGLGRASRADDPPAGSTPSPVPVTREDMKKALEASKHNVPRLPLPPPTADEIAKAEAAAKARAEAARKSGQPDTIGRAMGGGIVNNGRMRNLYLSDYGSGFGLMPTGGPRPQAKDAGPGDPGDPRFQTMLFWIVSRGNNCTYCMGHQEVKLTSAGMTDDQIAALDGDWSEFTPKERAAFAFAKKLTFAPHAISDADVAAMKAHYTDAQVVEVLGAIAGFNAMNRWTGALRIPQEDHRVYLTPTSEKVAHVVSRVAPASPGKTSGLVPPAPSRRPALESRAEVEAALAAARDRSPRLALADESATKAALETLAGENPPQWMRLLAPVPRGTTGRVSSFLNAESKGTLDPKTKAIIAWVAARNDRAWYALGHARERLKALGYSDDKIFALDDWNTIDNDADREVARFAKTLAIDPALIIDDDFTRLRKHFTDKKIAEVIHQVTQAASFDRLTEAAGLRLEK
jgi:alkylhydroperoxidase family enzyme